jgi:hypothetical protein
MDAKLIYQIVGVALREKQNYVYALPPVENLHQELFSVIYFFFQHPTCLETTIPTANRVPIFTH